MLITRMSGGTRRRAPVEFMDAVELHFRKSGRHANLVWIAEPICQWQIRVTMRPNDPALKAWQAGDVDTEPVETVEITYFDEDAGLYIGYELDELGVSGLIAMLDRGNMHSGTGQVHSLQDAMTKQVEAQREHREKLRKYIHGEVEAAARSLTHIIKKEPYLTVGIDFNESPPAMGPTQEQR